MTVLLFLASAALTLPSCEKEPSVDIPDESVDETVAGETTTAGEITTAAEDETDPPVKIENFEITSSVSVVYGHRGGNTERLAAERVAAAIADAYSIEVSVKTDWEYANGCEILVGKCGYRESSVAFVQEMYARGYGYSVLSGTEIAIAAKKDENLIHAAELFIDEVIKQTDRAVFEVGRSTLCNNERPVAEYIVNGVELSKYVIVSDKVSIAEKLGEAINDNLYTELAVVDSKSFVGGHAIKIGSFGCKDYDGERYAISSETVGGISTVYIDGATDALLEAGAEFLVEKYLSRTPTVAEIAVPERVYAHLGGTKIYEVSSEETVLAEGVTYYRKHYNNFADKNVDVFITAVSGDSPATFGVWVADFDSKSGKAKLDVKTVGTIAREFEKTGVNVVAATNAGFFHKAAGTNYPWGMQIVDGEVIWEPSHENDTYSNNWIGLTFDGKFVGGDVDDYEKIYKGKIKYGVGGGGYLMRDGALKVKPTKTSAGCYTAIAFTEDGGFVLLCVDGRPHLRDGQSEGASSFDLVSIFRDLDLEYTDVFYLDGGGSVEMVTERVVGSAAFTTRNDPSDGNSRPVSDIVAVYIPKE